MSTNELRITPELLRAMADQQEKIEARNAGEQIPASRQQQLEEALRDLFNACCGTEINKTEQFKNARQVLNPDPLNPKGTK